MKTTIITSVFAVLVSTMNLSAKNITTYSNVESSEAGVKKEYVSLNKETTKPESKDYYHYDKNGSIIEKTASIWNNEKGWVNSKKYEYQYDEVGKVINITYTEWDKAASNQVEKSYFITYTYDKNNEFLSLGMSDIENIISNDNNLITQK